MKRLFLPLAALFAAPLVQQATADVVSTPTQHCTKIPDDKGRAGMAAVSVAKPNGILMLGGANFPDAKPDAKTPEERGAKKFYNEAFFKKDGKFLKFDAFPYPVGYSAFGYVNLTNPEDKKDTLSAMLVVGGENATGHLASATTITLKEKKAEKGQKFEKEEDKYDFIIGKLPDLPCTLSSPAFVVVDDTIYVMGGLENRDDTECSAACFKLKLDKKSLEGAIEAQKAAAAAPAPAPAPAAAAPAEAPAEAAPAEEAPAEAAPAEEAPAEAAPAEEAPAEAAPAPAETPAPAAAPQPQGLHWEKVAAMPSPRMLATAGVVNGKIYVVGGCSLHKNAEGKAERTYLDDVLCYDPSTNKWSTVETKAPATIVGAANPMPVKGDKIYLIGGDPGEFYRASLAGNAPADHPGQSTKVYSFNTASNEWVEEGELALGVATTPVVQRGDTLLVISGEIKPGVRTPLISTVEIMDSWFYKTIIKPIVPAVNGFCSFTSPFTLVGAIAVFVVAIMLGIKLGFKSKPIPPTAPVTKPGKWAWAAVAVLWVVVMLNYFDRQLLAVLNTSITEGEGCIEMTQAQFGMVTSAFLIVYALLSPVGGFLADRFSRKLIILISLVVWSAVTWFTGAAQSYGELLFYRAAMGISEAFYIPAALALISDYHRGKTRSLATGLHMSGIYAGQMLAGCGAMMSGAPFNLGWRLTFESFGFIGVAYALIVILFLHDPEAPKEEAAAAPAGEKKEEAPAADSAEFGIMEVLKNLFSTRAMALLLLLISFAGAANWFLMGWYPRLLQDMFNISEAEAGPTATLWINIAKYVAVLGGAFVADMWYTRNKNARAYVPGISFLVAGPCVMIAMLPAIGVPFALGLGVTVALVSMQGVAQGSLDATLMPVLRSHIDERFSATGYGLLNLTSVGAGALVSWLGGYLKDANVGLGVPLCAAGALMMVCGALLFLLPKHK